MALVAVERARYGKRVEKAGRREPWQRIISIADAAVPEMERAFFAAVMAAQRGADLDKLAQAVERGDAEAALAAAGMSAFEEKFAEKMEELVREIVASAGRVAAQELAGKIPGAVTKAAPKGPRLAFSFNMRNPRSLQWIAAHAAELVAGVGQSTKDGIKAVVKRAFEEGGHPYEQARQIKQMIGLDPRRAAALANYELAQLRQGIDPAEVQKRADKYREELLKQRAQMIARTETIAAACEGQREAWRQAVDSGLLVEEEWERKWIVTPDDRLCPLCMARENKRAQVHGSYPDGSGGPPLHPGCRCAEGLVRVKPPGFREKPEVEVEMPEAPPEPPPLSAGEIDYANRMAGIWNEMRDVDEHEARITLAVAAAKGMTKPAAVMEGGDVDALVSQGWTEFGAVLQEVDEDIDMFLGEKPVAKVSPWGQMAGVWLETEPGDIGRVLPPGGVFRVAVDPAAKIAEWDDIAAEMAERNRAMDMARRLRSAGLNEAAEVFEYIGNSPSAYAAYLGYDGIRYGARVCMVNRSAMRIQRTPVWGKAVEGKRLWEPIGPRIKGRDIAPEQEMPQDEALEASSALKDMFVGEWPRLKDDYDERYASNEQRGYAKDKLVSYLAGRLSRDEALEAAKFIRGTQPVDSAVAEQVEIERIAYSAVNDIIHRWAATSGDRDNKSIAMQLVAAIEFGVEAPVEHWPEYNRREAERLVNGYGRAVAKILREMYNWTQEELKRRGIDRVMVYRGHKFKRRNIPKWLRDPHYGQVGKISLQPLNSFSRIYDVAQSFAWPSEDEAGYVFAAAIPRERIIATCRTGYGCLTEAELVVLGGKNKEVTVREKLTRF